MQQVPTENVRAHLDDVSHGVGGRREAIAVHAHRRPRVAPHLVQLLQHICSRCCVRKKQWGGKGETTHRGT